MLVVSRKIHEAIIVDGPIKITIVDIRGDKVRIGFDGPGNVRREEIISADEQIELPRYVKQVA